MLQSEEKQSSWAAEVVADEHALSARCPDPPVGHGKKATAGANESVTAHVTPEVATPGDGSSGFGPRPVTMPAQVISVAFGPMSGPLPPSVDRNDLVDNIHGPEAQPPIVGSPIVQPPQVPDFIASLKLPLEESLIRSPPRLRVSRPHADTDLVPRCSDRLTA